MANTWLKILLSRRYSITVAGDSIPIKKQSSPIDTSKNQLNNGNKLDKSLSDATHKKSLDNSKELINAEEKESFLFIANYSSLINPLLLNLCLGTQKTCYCMTKTQRCISPFLNNISKIISVPESHIYNSPMLTGEKEADDEKAQSIENEKSINTAQGQKNQNEHSSCSKYLEARQNTIEKAIQVIQAKESLVIWTSDELQKSEHEVMNNCIAFNVLKQLQENNLPLPELFLVRIEGVWGSIFSRYEKNSMPTFFASLFQKIHLLLLGPFLKQRPVQITFRRHKLNSSDLNSLEIFDNLIKNWYTASNNGALIVPILSFYESKHMPISMPSTAQLTKPREHEHVLPKKLKVVEKLSTVQSEQVKDNFIPNPEEQRKKSQNMPILAEITPTVIRTPPLMVIQHSTTRQGSIMDISTSTYYSRRTLLGLAKAINSNLIDLSASNNIGIALPVGLGSMAAFIAIFDCTPEENRLPVMLDYTLDSKTLEQCTQLANIKFIITSKSLENFVLPADIIPIYIEDISQSQITKGEFASFMGFAGNTDIDLPAVMLFNTDNEIVKAFTLTHRNLMSCLGDIVQLCTSPPINATSFSLLCCLPSYTSLGLLSNIIMPLTCGIPALTIPHTPHNLDINQLTRIAENYNVNLYIGTSTNLEQILRNALIHLPFRYAIVHTDSDMSYIYNNFSQICPDAILMQALSSNECSSIVSLNTRQQPDSIGQILPSLNYSIQNELLYVRGPSVFSGYLNNAERKTDVDDDPTQQEWFCLNTKVKDDEDEFLYLID